MAVGFTVTINMDEHQNPEEAVESGKDHLRAAAGNLKEAASAKVENIRHAAEQKADELRSAAQSTAQELKGTAESWQAEGHAYIRDNPNQVCPNRSWSRGPVGPSVS